LSFESTEPTSNNGIIHCHMAWISSHFATTFTSSKSSNLYLMLGEETRHLIFEIDGAWHHLSAT
jgi:hypothetical protein